MFRPITHKQKYLMDDNYHLIDDNCPVLKKVIIPLVLNVVKVLSINY